MRSLRLPALLWLIVAACAKQNNPRPEEDLGAGGEGDSGGKASTGGQTSTGGSTTTTAGKASSGGTTGGSAPDENGGTLSSSGTGGKSGSAGKGGSSGSAGKGGSGGSGGKGGAGGGGGKGGSGGGGSAGSGCTPSPSGPISGISARYQSEINGTTASGIGSKLIIANTGQSTVDLGSLKLRYYLTNEVQAALGTNVNWAYYTPVLGGSQVDKKANVAFSLVTMSCTSPSANAYFEFTFVGAGNLEPDHRIYFSWTANNGASQNFTQSNDYSFDAAATEANDDMKITVLKTDGTLVWGSEP